jgi:hypothetical protein
MRSTIKRRGLAALVLAVAPAAVALAGETYYVSPTGNDNADGLTPATAWASLGKVNAATFSPGSQILFARGGEWHDQLSASSSGTVQDPIVYGAYGSGAKPKFWGSDPIANSSFSKVAGTTSTYEVTSATGVNSVFANHDFFHSAFLNTNSADAGVNRTYVDANANSWFYDDAAEKLYVNTGGVNPAAGGTTYTAAVRDDVVFSNGKSNLVFKDLVVDESAKSNAGYAFRVQGGDNVRIEDAEAYRAGKHHFGVINSGGFVGERLYAESAMPDQGYGGATAFVAFSDAAQGRTADASQWLDSTAENLGGPYPAFYTHGTGVGDILVKNLTGKGGAGIAVSTDAAEKQNVRIVGGHLDDAGITVFGDDVSVDGVRLTGPKAYVDLRGNDNVVQNLLMTGTKPEAGYYSAMTDQGTGNVFQFNTVSLDPASPAQATAMAILTAATNSKLIGNIFDTPDAVLREWFQGQGTFQTDFNLYSPDARVILYDVWRTLAQWQAMGYDLSTLAADPGFKDALAGDFSLADGSPALDRIAPGQFAGLPGWDFLNDQRPVGAGYDLGAFESSVPEPATAGLIALAGCTGMLVRRRRRRPNC